jgi:hypothetical protein
MKSTSYASSKPILDTQGYQKGLAGKPNPKKSQIELDTLFFVETDEINPYGVFTELPSMQILPKLPGKP